MFHKQKNIIMTNLLLLMIFILITNQTIYLKNIFWLDLPIIHFIQQYALPTITKLMNTISFLGSDVFLAIISFCVGIYLLYLRRFQLLFAFSTCMILSGIFNFIFKNIFERPRPEILRLGKATGYSFPSGHAMAGICFYLFLAFMLSLELKKTFHKIMVYAIAVIFIISIGISRIYLGVHYPSDVLGGYTFGAAWFLCCVTFYFRLTADHKINRSF
jgi:membrane-associated phospholipid phosphatase